MAEMLSSAKGSIRLLDPGAGAGSLTTAYVSKICSDKRKPTKLEVTAFEIDREVAGVLGQSLAKCGAACERSGIGFDAQIRIEDFIQAGTAMIERGLFKNSLLRFNRVILNPPYKKINANSEFRRLLRRVGIETSNLYTAFLGLSILLLEPEGEMVAITPRSFCNGPYFKSFRKLFLHEMSICRIHLFASRDRAFSQDDVLQENIIFHAVKTTRRLGKVTVSTSSDPDDVPTLRTVTAQDIVKPSDPNSFIHVVSDDLGARASSLIGKLRSTLADLDIEISTGRIVDFRSREWLRVRPSDNTVPLIYPMHFKDGWIQWPRPHPKKANACVLDERSRTWLVETGVYVLVKRFSAKEERRRVVAAIFDPARVPCQSVGFENHLNYFHGRGHGLPMKLAKGLALFLNSTIVDAYFRQFSGHTQVNASDLRNIRYPSRDELEELGRAVENTFPNQEVTDAMIESRLPKWQGIFGGDRWG
jgi:adenine-specific DNA-methyltransferase